MRVGGALILCVVLACGRRGFEPRRHDAGSDARVVDARAVDAPTDADVTTGCADGQREAFIDQLAFPTIAGCTANWTTARDLRAARTGAACGDDLGACAEPADACAVGWHICLTAGDPAELSTKISGAACATAGDGAFVAAAGHCDNCMAPCSSGESQCIYTTATPLACPTTAIACAEPVCCGGTCAGNPNCRAGVFAAPDTMSDSTPCGNMTATSQTGVLCCAD